MIDLNQHTSEESSDTFRLEAIPMRPYEEHSDDQSLKDRGIMGIDIQMNLDAIFIQRKRY